MPKKGFYRPPNSWNTCLHKHPSLYPVQACPGPKIRRCWISGVTHGSPQELCQLLEWSFVTHTWSIYGNETPTADGSILDHLMQKPGWGWGIFIVWSSGRWEWRCLGLRRPWRDTQKCCWLLEHSLSLEGFRRHVHRTETSATCWLPFKLLIYLEAPWVVLGI